MDRLSFLRVRGLRACAAALLAAGLAAPSLAENSIEDFHEPNLDIELSVGLQRLDEGLMGESIDLEAGGLSIRHVDVSLPGDFPLPVEFVRTFTLDAPDFHAGRLGGWNYDIPFISARSGTERLDASAAGYAMRFDRCSNGAPARIGPTPNVEPGYWSGWKLYSPGRGGRMMLTAPAGPASLYGGAKPAWITEDHWKIDCLPTTQNNKGEGFVATAPNGVKYYYDFAAEIFTGRYERIGATGDNDDEHGGMTVEQPTPGLEYTDVPIYDLNLYATRVEDVHGNTVDYEYDDGGRLLAIRGSDGREITISYQAAQPSFNGPMPGRIETVSAHGRVWRYSYGGPHNNKLNRIELPDGRDWTFTLPGAHGAYVGFPCFSAGPLADIATITHPDGMRAEFKFARIWNGRNNTDGGAVLQQCPKLRPLQALGKPGPAHHARRHRKAPHPPRRLDRCLELLV